MAEQPTKLPEWASDANRTLEPTAGEKGTGWQVDDKPPARKMNWLLNTIYTWCQYLQTPVGTGAGAGIAATGGTTSGSGLKGTGGAPNGKGVYGIGDGTGDGVQGLASGDSNSSAGVTGLGDVSGAATLSYGVYGAGAADGAGDVGTGIVGVGAGAGQGVKGTASGANNVSVGIEGVGNVTGAATTSDGVKGEGAGTDGHGVVGVGAGTGPGIDGTGGVGGTGVVGLGGGPGTHGVHGTGTTDGAGVYGTSASGHGVVAESDTTTPAKSALRIVPQDTDPSVAPVRGDEYVHTVDGVAYLHNGTIWVPQVGRRFASVVASASITTLGLQTYNQNYTIPANTLRVGSTIRVWGWIEQTSHAGGNNVFFRLSLGGVTIALTGTVAANSAEDIMLEAVAVIRSLGAGGTFSSCGRSIQESSNAILPLVTQSNAIDTTAANMVYAEVNYVANGNASQLEGIIVDIS